MVDMQAVFRASTGITHPRGTSNYLWIEHADFCGGPQIYLASLCTVSSWWPIPCRQRFGMMRISSCMPDGGCRVWFLVLVDRLYCTVDRWRLVVSAWRNDLKTGALWIQKAWPVMQVPNDTGWPLGAYIGLKCPLWTIRLNCHHGNELLFLVQEGVLWGKKKAHTDWIRLWMWMMREWNVNTENRPDFECEW